MITPTLTRSGIIARTAAIFGAAAVMCAAALPSSALDYKISINGANVALAEPPVDNGGRVFVPMRQVFQGLNAGVVYDNGTINATSGNRTVQVKIGSNQAVVDGQAVYLDASPFVDGSTAMVPLRFVSEALGAVVNFDSTTGQIAISPEIPEIQSGAQIRTTLGADINTKSAYIGEPITLTAVAPYPAGADVLAGAKFLGRVIDVQRAGMGTQPRLQIAVDSIELANSADPQPVSASVASIEQNRTSPIPKEAGGTLAGMLIGNWIGKSLDSNQGGIVGAAGGYLLTANSKENVDVPAGSPVILQLTGALSLK
jgi:hypothetical protein